MPSWILVLGILWCCHFRRTKLGVWRDAIDWPENWSLQDLTGVKGYDDHGAEQGGSVQEQTRKGAAHWARSVRLQGCVVAVSSRSARLSAHLKSWTKMGSWLQPVGLQDGWAGMSHDGGMNAREIALIRQDGLDRVRWCKRRRRFPDDSSYT